jgi:hypothetical protein
MAFGAMVDVAIVMVENTRKQLQRRNEAGVGLRWNHPLLLEARGSPKRGAAVGRFGGANATPRRPKTNLTSATSKTKILRGPRLLPEQLDG